MRTIRRMLLSAAATAALASPAVAATINVSSTCSFDQAVQALNTKMVVGGCAAGNGSSDTIRVPSGTFNVAASVVTTIGRSVQVIGAGRSSTILQCNRFEDQYHLAGVVALKVSGPMFGAQPTVTIRSLTLQGGSGNNVGGFWQLNGGSASQSANVTLDDVRVTGFRLTGISNTSTGGTTTITNSRVDHMDVNSNEGPAGGISNDGVMSISHSTIELNSSTQGAGILNGRTGQLQIYASTIANNSADYAGGGLSNSGDVLIGHSTFSGNGALQNGGAIFLQAGTDPASLQMYFSTVVFNSADGGGGISEQVNGLNTVLLQDNLIASNSGIFAADVDADLQFYGRNLITNSDGVVNASSRTIFGVSPSLGPLTTVDSAPATHALLPGSAGIDQGVEDQNFFDNTVDERGFPRAMDGDNNGVSDYDLGAVEFDPWQTERLAVAAKSSDTHSIVNDPSYSNGQGTWLQSNAANDFVTYRVPLPAAGTYNIKVRMRRGNNRGRVQSQTASNLTGAYANLGAVQDGYASSAGFVELNLGNFTVSSFGMKYLRFLVTGKNSASSGYQVTLDYLKITKQ